LDCIPCFVQQTLDACRFINDDEDLHERVLRKVLELTGGMDMRDSPPAMAARIHRLIREMTGRPDPYHQVKQDSNAMLLSMIDDCRRRIDTAADPLEMAVRLAIGGNTIDCGIRVEYRQSCIHTALDHAVEHSLVGEIDKFAQAADRAERILYLLDNSGEIVLDRLLMERLPTEKITAAVRGGPILNDVTIEDARQVGLADVAPVIDNGSDAPGTILEQCSESFRRAFDAADLIIAKGQGNFETLSETPRNIFFLLKAKCPVIASHIGCPIGSHIAYHQADV